MERMSLGEYILFGGSGSGPGEVEGGESSVDFAKLLASLQESNSQDVSNVRLFLLLLALLEQVSWTLSSLGARAHRGSGDFVTGGF